MPILRLKEPPHLAGDYDADISSFTNRELHQIKTETGVRAGEIEEAFAAGDNDVLVAITLIILQRAGKGTVAQLSNDVWELPAGSVEFDLTDAEKQPEDDAVPPTSGLDSSTNANGSSESSGPDSSVTGGDQANFQSHIGSPLSDTGAISDPLTLAS